MDNIWKVLLVHRRRMFRFGGGYRRIVSGIQRAAQWLQEKEIGTVCHARSNGMILSHLYGMPAYEGYTGQ